jgi:hypothetical protein
MASRESDHALSGKKRKEINLAFDYPPYLILMAIKKVSLLTKILILSLLYKFI